MSRTACEVKSIPLLPRWNIARETQRGEAKSQFPGMSNTVCEANCMPLLPRRYVNTACEVERMPSSPSRNTARGMLNQLQVRLQVRLQIRLQVRLQVQHQYRRRCYLLQPSRQSALWRADTFVYVCVCVCMCVHVRFAKSAHAYGTQRRGCKFNSRYVKTVCEANACHPCPAGTYVAKGMQISFLRMSILFVKSNACHTHPSGTQRGDAKFNFQVLPKTVCEVEACYTFTNTVCEVEACHTHPAGTQGVC